jgi:phage baseplate assembly protein W
LNLVEVPISGELVIELDGINDLDKYLLTNNAYVRVYKPNTINSNFNLLIPSMEEIIQLNQDIPWFLAIKSEVEKRAGVDLLLDDDGDLTLSATNDVGLNFGLNNIMQAIKIFLQTELGEIILHPEFGFPVSTRDTNKNAEEVRLMMVQAIEGFVSNDDRMERLEKLEIEKITQENSASGFSVGMMVKLKGSNQLLPITFNIGT